MDDAQLHHGVSGARKRPQAFDQIGLSERDRRILALARHKLAGATVDFGEALRALQEAVEESIPTGRVYLLGTTELGPIIGSLISGVGIVAGAEGVTLVRIDREKRMTTLGGFST